MSSVDDSKSRNEPSAGKDLKAASVDAVPVTTEEGQVLTPNVEYERYLELHHLLDGPKRKKFMRKRKSGLLWVPQSI